METDSPGNPKHHILPCFQPLEVSDCKVMKIGFSTFVLAGGRSGIATYIRELIRFLQLADTENRYELLMTKNDADLIPISNPHFSKRLFPSYTEQALLSIVWHNTALPALGKYDVVHIPTARRIPLLKKSKVVATVHDLAAFAIDGKYDPARMLFNRKLIPAMIRNADHVITVSESSRNDLIRYTRYPEEQISVIYPGINRDMFQPVEQQEARERLELLHGLEKPFIIYVSRLEHPGKNHIRLIKAFERFKLENDSAHQLILAGADWSGAEQIKQRAAESPVKDDILFPGYVSVKSLALLYSACDLMVFPSLFEGFGLPIIEALACGAPVICSNTSSMKEIAKDRIPTFDPMSSESIFQALESALAKGPAEQERAEGMAYAATFDWRTTAERVMSIYGSVC
ncbi:glycosyltransferase family 4 protein [Pontiella agarivorans]|uniref:Glycosyltransferase family 1 protein n=1 Tax=Pontiella agarivorans TaxID=3038953 RepID=A0ABU5MX28_9BACT|nr:glycosyltransferase family 1 protein [Pontiella agarivorans]MDZ8118712.1 glycosyltransferase family 1 protein [Pontiella agarivorans]